MATVTRFEYTDDIDDKTLDVDDLNVVAWSWLGVDYELDTSTANLDRIENGRLTVATLLAKSRRVGGRRRSAGRSPRSSLPAIGSADTKAIREWAQRNGYTISSRGRIPADIVEAFAKQH